MAGENKKEIKRPFLRSGWGVLIGLSVGVVSAFSNTCIALAQVGGASQYQVSFFKGLGGALFLTVVLMCKGIKFIPESLRDKIIVSLNALINAVSGLGLVYALPRAPSGNVITILHGTLPVFTPLFACICLKERWRCIDAVSTIIDIAGIILIAKPEFIFGSDSTAASSPDEAFAYLTVTLAAMGLSSNYVFGRWVGPSVHPLTTSFYVEIFVTLVNAILMYAISSPTWMLAWYVWLEVAAVCVLGTYEDVGRYRSLQLEAAPTVVLLGSIQIIILYILDLTALDADVDELDLIGAALILISTVFVTVMSWRSNFKRNETQPEEEMHILADKN
ncbi:solute carrier family 35 member G1-like [Ptychodera flava]|uniref:solute carrier family 35 member G1-like n=1 Tax=Ptychodera flava TaxID=63121 RepID=UPI00396A3B9A